MLMTFYILIMAFNLIIFNFELHNYDYDKYQKTDNKTDGPGGGLLIEFDWSVCFDEILHYHFHFSVHFTKLLYCFYELLNCSGGGNR